MSSSVNITRPERVLRRQDGPLVWIDCEMTGLDLEKDRLIEIAVIVTDGNLKQVDDGVDWVIKTDKAVLDRMGEWCTAQHAKSGLTEQCLASEHTHEWVTSQVLEYIKARVPDKGVAVLAGNSVHADAAFLKLEEGRGMRSVIDHLHYRIVDVSTIKELAARWSPRKAHDLRSKRKTEGSHRALDDIRGSIEELKQYRSHLFIQQP